MQPYPKIHSVYKRDEKGNMLWGKYSLPEFEYLANNEWVFTEKVDGTNIRVIWEDHTLTFMGRTDKAQIPLFLLDKLDKVFSLERMAAMFDDDACLYGEGYGARIQGGGGNYIPNGVDFVLFDIRIGDVWLKQVDVRDIGTRLGLTCVPVIGTGTLEDMLEKTRLGFNSLWGEFPAEGIVARPKIDLNDRGNRRIITKAKHKDWKV